ncbi:MAG: putative metal-binding motif-containing protein, partial [Deltaproteobacteria bacterium]|nr:putative metal-binding motif-containing protein [Deltaproteobacteria bacterium]
MQALRRWSGRLSRLASVPGSRSGRGLVAAEALSSVLAAAGAATGDLRHGLPMNTSLPLLATVVLALSLAACGGEESKPPSGTATGMGGATGAGGTSGGGGGTSTGAGAGGGSGLTTDDDGDGYSEVQGDCNDQNADIHPGAVEICDDGIDNNCNGAKDAAEPDGDGDGFGPCQGDCNDADANVSPAQKELPDDAIDNNCDGIVDGDYDGDGYTAAGGDCDDG